MPRWRAEQAVSEVQCPHHYPRAPNAGLPRKWSGKTSESRGLNRSHLAPLTCLVVGLAISNAASSGAFWHSGVYGPGTVTHPELYTGAGGNLTITVGIDPTSAHKDDMVIPLKNVIKVWNELEPMTGNLVTGNDNKVDPDELDFESVLLHELGHALGAFQAPRRRIGSITLRRGGNCSERISRIERESNRFGIGTRQFLAFFITLICTLLPRSR